MRQLLGKIFLVGIGLIVALALCEVGLRLLGIGYPQFYEYDPGIGARLRPGIKGYWLEEGGGYVSINSDGLRDREHAIKKPPNTLRIAVLGDSFAEAMQVNRSEAFWAIMEKKLQSCKNLQGRHVEVINFGQSGFGTTQELLALRQRAWKYSPDIVLLAFCTGNDITDNSVALNNRDTETFYVLKDGKLVLDNSRTKRAGENWEALKKKYTWKYDFYRWRLDNFRILQLFYHVQKIVGDWWSSKNSGVKPGSVCQGTVEPGMFTAIYREPTDEKWKEAWKVTEAVLLQMRDEIAQKQAQFFVVVESNDIQVNPDASDRNQLIKCPGVKDVFYPDHRLEKFCQDHSIPVLLLAPYFQEYASQHQVYLHGFRTLFRNTLGRGHWNRDGHRLAGETIAQWLCPQIK
jgi:hypothetical protein